MKKVCALLILVGLSVAVFLSSPASSQGKKDKLRRNPNKIENNYIVVLDESIIGERGRFSIAPYVASELAATHQGKLTHVYQHAINGFAIQMTEQQAEALGQDPEQIGLNAPPPQAREQAQEPHHA